MDYLEFRNPGFSKGTYQGGVSIGNENIAVWELAWIEEMSNDKKFKIIPPTCSEFALRQNAQQGVFTKLSHDLHYNVEDYLSSRDLAQYLSKYIIPVQEAYKALADLKLMNITLSTMSPDLDGAASMANCWNMFDGF